MSTDTEAPDPQATFEAEAAELERARDKKLADLARDFVVACRLAEADFKLALARAAWREDER